MAQCTGRVICAEQALVVVDTSVSPTALRLPDVLATVEDTAVTATVGTVVAKPYVTALSSAAIESGGGHTVQGAPLAAMWRGNADAQGWRIAIWTDGRRSCGRMVVASIDQEALRGFGFGGFFQLLECLRYLRGRNALLECHALHECRQRHLHGHLRWNTRLLTGFKLACCVNKLCVEEVPFTTNTAHSSASSPFR